MPSILSLARPPRWVALDRADEHPSPAPSGPPSASWPEEPLSKDQLAMLTQRPKLGGRLVWVTHATKLAALEHSADEMYGVLKSFFADQAKVLAPLVGAAAAPPTELAISDAVDAALAHYDWTPWADVLRPQLEPLLGGAFAQGAKDMWGAVRSAGLSLTWDLVAPKIQGYAEDRGAEMVGKRIASDGRVTDAKTAAFRIDEATRAEMQTDLAKWMKEGRSMPEMAQAILDRQYTGFFPDWRARRIARTESTIAYNRGNLAGMGGAGIEHVQVLDGTEFDEACAVANGQQWTLAQAGAMPIEHPNCSRTFVGIVVPATVPGPTEGAIGPEPDLAPEPPPTTGSVPGAVVAAEPVSASAASEPSGAAIAVPEAAAGAIPGTPAVEDPDVKKVASGVLSLANANMAFGDGFAYREEIRKRFLKKADAVMTEAEAADALSYAISEQWVLAHSALNVADTLQLEALREFAAETYGGVGGGLSSWAQILKPAQRDAFELTVSATQEALTARGVKTVRLYRGLAPGMEAQGDEALGRWFLSPVRAHDAALGDGLTEGTLYTATVPVDNVLVMADPAGAGDVWISEGGELTKVSEWAPPAKQPWADITAGDVSDLGAKLKAGELTPDEFVEKATGGQFKTSGGFLQAVGEGAADLQPTAWQIEGYVSEALATPAFDHVAQAVADLKAGKITIDTFVDVASDGAYSTADEVVTAMNDPTAHIPLDPDTFGEIFKEVIDAQAAAPAELAATAPDVASLLEDFKAGKVDPDALVEKITNGDVNDWGDFLELVDNSPGYLAKFPGAEEVANALKDALSVMEDGLAPSMSEAAAHLPAAPPPSAYADVDALIPQLQAGHLDADAFVTQATKGAYTDAGDFMDDVATQAQFDPAALNPLDAKIADAITQAVEGGSDAAKAYVDSLPPTGSAPAPIDLGSITDGEWAPASGTTAETGLDVYSGGLLTSDNLAALPVDWSTPVAEATGGHLEASTVEYLTKKALGTDDIGRSIQRWVGETYGSGAPLHGLGNPALLSDEFKADLKVTFQATQDALKAQGVTDLRLYRFVRTKKLPANPADLIGSVSTAEGVSGRALDTWFLDPAQAQASVKKGTGFIEEMVLPVDRVALFDPVVGDVNVLSTQGVQATVKAVEDGGQAVAAAPPPAAVLQKVTQSDVASMVDAFHQGALSDSELVKGATGGLYTDPAQFMADLDAGTGPAYTTVPIGTGQKLKAAFAAPEPVIVPNLTAEHIADVFPASNAAWTQAVADSAGLTTSATDYYVGMASGTSEHGWEMKRWVAKKYGSGVPPAQGLGSLLTDADHQAMVDVINATQAELAAKGVDQVTLYRAVRKKSLPAGFDSSMVGKVGTTGDNAGRALDTWYIDPVKAQNQLAGSKGWVERITLPRENVGFIRYPATSPEVHVLTTKGSAAIITDVATTDSSVAVKTLADVTPATAPSTAAATVAKPIEPIPETDVPTPTGMPFKVEELQVAPADERVTGGTHPKETYQAPDGSLWLFKAQSEFTAQGDVVTSRIAKAAGLDAPDTYVVTIGGQVGSIQRVFGTAATRRTLFKEAFDPTRLTPEMALDLEEHSVFDWLIGNHDTHRKQWIRLSGSLKPIETDLGQAFKFYGKDRLDWTYNPNSKVEPEGSVYNLMHAAFADGKPIDLPLLAKKSAASDALKAFIQRLQGISDADFAAMLRPYAEGAAARGELAVGSKFANNVDGFLRAAIDRKNSLMDDWSAFQDKMVTKRDADRLARMPKAPANIGLKGMDAPGAQTFTSLQNARTKLRKIWPKTSLPASTPAARGMASYTGGGYRSMNQRLRLEGDKAQALASFSDDGAKALSDWLVAHPVPANSEDLIVWRGSRSNPWAQAGDPQNLLGHVLEDRGFQSTAIVKEKAWDGQIMMRIRVPAGTPGALVDQWSSSGTQEAEFLLDNHLKFFVHDVYQAPHHGVMKTWLDVEVLPADAQVTTPASLTAHS